MGTVTKTSLSAGDIIYSVLSSDADISSRVTKIYPVVEPVEAICPYIVYRRVGLSVMPQKSGQPGADTLQIAVGVYAQHYEDSVDIAELVRSALDYKTYEIAGLRMRGCYLSGSSEEIEGDAFVQNLLFTIKI